MRAADVIAADQLARAGFRYQGDGLFDTWRSHADAALAGELWAGDCDDLASTVLDLVTRQGLALDRTYRLLVSSTGAPGFDHMVAAVQAEDGAFLLVGDTFGGAYPAGRMRHLPVKYQRLDEFAAGENRWRDGAPWTA